MTRYGYARVSTREQNPNSQRDALTAAGIAEADIVIEKISGKLASRPKLDKLLAGLERGDAVVVTRLRRIGRNHKHLLELVEWFEANGVDFIVLEQGIDTTTPIGRLFFRFLAALAGSTGRRSSRAPLRAWRPPGPAAGWVAGRPADRAQARPGAAHVRRRRADRRGDRRGRRRRPAHLVREPVRLQGRRRLRHGRLPQHSPRQGRP